MRRWCTPPLNGVSSQVARICSASSGSDHLRPEDQHVGVVVAARDLGVQQVGAQAGPDAADLVAGDGLARAAAADDDAAVRRAGDDLPADVVAQRRVVDHLAPSAAPRSSTSWPCAVSQATNRSLRTTPLWSAAIAMRTVVLRVRRSGRGCRCANSSSRAGARSRMRLVDRVFEAARLEHGAVGLEAVGQRVGAGDLHDALRTCGRWPSAASIVPAAAARRSAPWHGRTRRTRRRRAPAVPRAARP